MQIHPTPKLILQFCSYPQPYGSPARCGVSHYREWKSLDDNAEDRDPPLWRARLHQREIQAIHAQHDMEIWRRQQRTPPDVDVQSILRLATMPYPPIHYILHLFQASRGL
ncbi:hypothetical protein KP509_14G011000 [Ceratopteris richardii]|uniref:Uncharacterized protein n=1 Tax=Ceratopteris richardii TaxID=49495 RepID=A0A8T2T5L9_CERRI|nr:hypothetical protein KP509_1Z288200 [Ceratopteris richardii]KAH7414780.1 hypothetical protein KP509_14G011000 [Ceratopteris richardii]